MLITGDKLCKKAVFKTGAGSVVRILLSHSVTKY